jgi:hypothetical protein
MKSLKKTVGTTHSGSSASQSQASNQPMLGNGGVNIWSHKCNRILEK